MNNQTIVRPSIESLDARALTERLTAIADRARRWLAGRRNPDGAGFGLCEGATVPVELNATTGGVELWCMLGLPLTARERESWVNHLADYQQERSGLVVDPTWRKRQIREDSIQLTDGDSFFTMTAAAALDALGAQFRFPVAYLAEASQEDLKANASFERIAHYPFGIGDFGRLVRHNEQLGIPGAHEQWYWMNQMLVDTQDATGLWPKGEVDTPYTPHINNAFHILRSSWNLSGQPIERADQLVNACLAAAGNDDFYSWETGFACNDLDLAHVAYSAAKWTDHRSDELASWARSSLGQVLGVEKAGGGFSFYHERAMDRHAGIRMSASRSEADTWGTLMYLGTIKMMVELGWPGVQAPWAFSKVHATADGAMK